MPAKIDPRFARTMFVVEADSFSRHMLWLHESKEARDAGYGPAKPGHPPQVWEQDSGGIYVEVGMFGKMPICIDCFWTKIDGQLVLFYDACSMVTHARIVDDWLKANCNPTWDGGKRPARCNAMNFHHCLDAIAERNNPRALTIALEAASRVVATKPIPGS